MCTPVSERIHCILYLLGFFKLTVVWTWDVTVLIKNHKYPGHVMVSHVMVGLQAISGIFFFKLQWSRVNGSGSSINHRPVHAHYPRRRAKVADGPSGENRMTKFGKLRMLWWVLNLMCGRMIVFTVLRKEKRWLQTKNIMQTYRFCTYSNVHSSILVY